MASRRKSQTTTTRGKGVTSDEKVIEAAGARLLYLPPYSPDFNTIELAFSKLKALLRKAAARTISEIWDVIALCLDQFTTNECQNYFTAFGYEFD